MKPATLMVLLASTALAILAENVPLAERQSLEAITDQYLFVLTLAQFTAKRNARDPATLDWASNDCTLSPDNPLGFPFAPACQRHDFGYANYVKQSRFTEAGRLRIDNQFQEDLYHQCQAVTFRRLCRALADVYYTAVRIFGGLFGRLERSGTSDDDLLREYEEKVAIYNALVQVAQKYGEVAAGNGTI